MSILLKAMTDLRDPTFETADRRKRKYPKMDSTEVKKMVIAGKVNVALVRDIDYAETMDAYKSKLRRIESSMENWEENHAK